MKKQPVVDGAAEVAEEALESSQVGLSGIMHVETDLLHNVCDVRPGESVVLKCTSKTPVRSGVCHWTTLSLTTCPECQLEWSKACSQSSLLALGYQECTAIGVDEAQWDETNSDPEKMMDTQILQRELLLKSASDSDNMMDTQILQRELVLKSADDAAQ